MYKTLLYLEVHLIFQYINNSVAKCLFDEYNTIKYINLTVKYYV